MIFKNILLSLLLATNVFAQTPANNFSIGAPTNVDKKLIFNRNGAKGTIKWNESSGRLQFANDGSTYSDLGSGSGGGNDNLLGNPGFEQGISTAWSNTGGTYVLATGGDILFETKAVSFTASSGGQFFESSLYAVPPGLYGGSCGTSFWYKGGDANLEIDVIDGSNATVTTLTLSTSATPKYLAVPFTCPSSGTFKVRIASTAAAAQIAADNFFLGPAQSTASGTSTVFLASGSMTATSSRIHFFAAGGGGGGGGGRLYNSGGGGGGGGAGAQPMTGDAAVVVGETITVTIGAGGIGNGINTVGATGGTTSISGSTTGFIANFYGALGGGSGNGATGQNAALGPAGTVFSLLYNGVILINGGDGTGQFGPFSYGGVYQSAGGAYGPGGYGGGGGGSGLGVGGAGGVQGAGAQPSVAGSPGGISAGGGGGGGGAQSGYQGSNGGTGGDGFVVITPAN